MLLAIYAKVIFLYPVLPIYSYIPFVYISFFWFCMHYNKPIYSGQRGNFVFVPYLRIYSQCYKSYQEGGGEKERKGILRVPTWDG